MVQRGEHLWLHQRGWRSGGISSCQNPVPSWHGSGRGLEESEQLLPQWCFSKAFVSFCGLAWSCPQVGLRCVGLRGAWAASREPLPWEFLVQELGRSRNPNGAEEQAGLVAPQLGCTKVLSGGPWPSSVCSQCWQLQQELPAQAWQPSHSRGTAPARRSPAPGLRHGQQHPAVPYQQGNSGSAPTSSLLKNLPSGTH